MFPCTINTFLACASSCLQYSINFVQKEYIHVIKGVLNPLYFVHLYIQKAKVVKQMHENYWPGSFLSVCK